MLYYAIGNNIVVKYIGSKEKKSIPASAIQEAFFSAKKLHLFDTLEAADVFQHQVKDVFWYKDDYLSEAPIFLIYVSDDIHKNRINHDPERVRLPKTRLGYTVIANDPNIVLLLSAEFLKFGRYYFQPKHVLKQVLAISNTPEAAQKEWKPDISVHGLFQPVTRNAVVTMLALARYNKLTQPRYPHAQFWRLPLELICSIAEYITTTRIGPAPKTLLEAAEAVRLSERRCNIQ